MEIQKTVSVIVSSVTFLMGFQQSVAQRETAKGEIECYASIEAGRVRLNFINSSKDSVFFCSYRFEYKLIAFDKSNRVLTDEDASLDNTNLLVSVDSDWILLRPGARLQVPTHLLTATGVVDRLERVKMIEVKHHDRWERLKPPRWLVDLRHRQGKIFFTTWRRR